MRRAIAAAVFAVLFAASLSAEAKRFTILHTNDLHSHLQGVSRSWIIRPCRRGMTPRWAAGRAWPRPSGRRGQAGLVPCWCWTPVTF